MYAIERIKIPKKCKDCGEKVRAMGLCGKCYRKKYYEEHYIKKVFNKKRCIICNKIFLPKRVKQKYCNIKCRIKGGNDTEKGKRARKKYLKTKKGRLSIKKYCKSEKFKETQKKYKQSEKGRRKQRIINSSKSGKRASKKYRESIKGKIRKKMAMCKRREKLNVVSHQFTKEEWFLKLYKTHGFCPMCDKWIGIDKLTLDHIIPVSKAPEGFIYSINEIQPLCQSCNSKKNDKD